MSLRGYTVECPQCGFTADAGYFAPSCADECECPKCGEVFEFEYGDYDDEEDDL